MLSAFSSDETSLPRIRLKQMSLESRGGVSGSPYKSRDALREEARQHVPCHSLQPADWSGNPSVVKTLAPSARVPPKLPSYANQRLKIKIRDVCAHDLPNADAVGGGCSDPLAIFTVLECDGVPSARTGVIDDTLNPEWPDELELITPTGAAPVRSRQPLLRVTVLDQDLGDEDDDDVLGQTELKLTEVSGAFFRAPMFGQGEFGGRKQDWISYISFSYEVCNYEPPQSANLVLSRIELGGNPSNPSNSEQRRGHPKLRARFMVAGLGETSAVSTPACMPTTSSFISWDEIVVVLELHQATRPLTLWVEILSDGAGEQGKPPVAAGDVKLAQTDAPPMEGVPLECLLKGRPGVEDVPMRFYYEIYDPPPKPSPKQLT